MHALAAVERDRGQVAEALDLLGRSLVLHREGKPPVAATSPLPADFAVLGFQSLEA